MKLLIFSWYFPPVNSIGAVRLGKLAKYLFERGHDIAVVAGKDWGLAETLPLGFPLERVAYARWFDVNAAPKIAQRMRGALSGSRKSDRSGNSEPASPSLQATTDARPSLANRLARQYVLLSNLPDNRIGWLPGTLREAGKLCRDWQPDLVFASGPPFTALLAARIFATRRRIPWIAELRDRWADDPYEELPAWRAALDQVLERRVLAHAAGLVTVTEPWAEFYRRKYTAPVETVYNGYDPADFPFDPLGPANVASPYLRIVYTGLIYPGRRDPTPLFEALRSLGEKRGRFRVTFYGTDPEHVLPLAERKGVRDVVEVLPGVPYREALALQWNADVLLLMQWNDPREQGNCPGKFFEYIASLRPIIGLGLENGVPATIIRERSAGIFSNDPPVIAAQLLAWLQEKESHGAVKRLPARTREGLTRELQFAKLEAFLLRIHEVASQAAGRP